MENVMNFLAENYIWFFVAAGVLLFALVGFLIEGKNKNKSEVKGESINASEPVAPAAPVKEESNEEILDFESNVPNLEEVVIANPENVENINVESAPAPETVAFETPTLEETPVNPELEAANTQVAEAKLEEINPEQNNN